MHIDLDDVENFVALGHTFGSHAVAPVEWPMVWTEPEQTLVEGGEEIVIPPEVEDAGIGPELTAVIGEDLHRATPAEAEEAVSALTVSNDISATGAWPGHPGGDVTSPAYKMFPTFRPVLTEGVPYDGSDEERAITAHIDGETTADSTTEEMRFTLGEMVADVSRVLQLEAGDMVALGEPHAEGTLRGAEEVTCEIEGVGELSNPIRESEDERVSGLNG